MRPTLGLFPAGCAILAGIAYFLGAPSETPASTCAETTIRLEADADAWIDQGSASTNKGSDGTLKVRTQSGGGNFRTLVRFALPADEPPGCIVSGATIELHSASSRTGRSLLAIRLNAGWLEETVNWSNQPPTDGPAASAASGSPVVQWDVTGQVQAMFDAGNNGFLIRDALENGGGDENEFASRDREEEAPALSITFAGPPTVDSTPPETWVVEGPADGESGAASFTFAGEDESTAVNDLRFECRLDGAAGQFTPCESPVHYGGLRPGLHEFEVRSVDLAGNPDDDPASHVWRVHHSGPLPLATVACGQVLTQDTQIANDLAGCLEDGLIIGADAIVVDLGGHTVGGVGLGSGVRNDGYDGVTILNGDIVGFDYGVRLDGATERNIFEGLDIELNQLAGIEVSGAGTRRNYILRNDVVGNAHGIALVNGSSGALVRDNDLEGNSGVGLLVELANSNRLELNELSGGSDDAVVLDSASGNTVIGNQAAAAGDGGFKVVHGSEGNLLEGNYVSGTGDAGFVVQDSNGNHLVGNIARDNSDSGIALDSVSGSVVRDNDVRFNPGGIELQSSVLNVIASNDASETSGNGIELDGTSLENVVVGNQASGNMASGIWVGSEAIDAFGNPVPGNSIAGNTADANGASGIYVAKGGHTLLANVANGNRGWGIYAGPGNLDAGDNVARQNVEPGQCFNVTCTPFGTPAPTASPTPTPTPSPTPTPTPTPSPTPTPTPTSAPDCGSPLTLTSNADAWVDQSSTVSNFGSDSILKVQAKSFNNFRALVRFPLPASLPAGCRVESATLRLYASSATSGRTLAAVRLSGSWTENGVTWINQPPPAGARATAASGPGYREWNVATQVQAMYDAGALHGFVVRDAKEGGPGTEQSFHSREKGANPPQLVVRFGPAGP